jgi:hypothetical protein
MFPMPRSAPVTNAQPPEIDTSVPHSARIWNYWLGGKDNYPVDRDAGDQFRQAFPEIVEVARSSRAFLVRAVGYLAGEAGVRQFLDVGTGLPTADNTHEVAQRVAPEARVVYVDNDPVVLAHARALLTSSPEGATAYVDADLHDPDTILRLATPTLDPTRPVALMLLGVLGHIADDEEARSVVKRLLDGLPSGSYLVLCDGTDTSQAGSRPRTTTTRAAPSPTGCAAPSRSPTSSPAWSWWNRAWCHSPGGDPTRGNRPPPEVDAVGGIGRKP